MKILVVEDNEKLAKYVETMLTEESYVVDKAADGEVGERMIRMDIYDLVVLDVMLPKKDGISVCKAVREAGFMLPILMLTARDTVEDRIEGLDSGADDYLIKPFAMDELLARVRSLLRRPRQRMGDTLTVKDVTIDHATHTVTRGREQISLTVKEYTILDYLMQHAGTVVTREQLIDHCWDFSYSAFSNITDVYIKQLRKKLGNGHENYIKTIRGVGYCFATS